MEQATESSWREPLTRRTTSDSVADQLRAAIVKGEFADGSELNQVTLARTFGVSRVPVREALRQLQAEGLVSARAHMRTVVVGFTLDRVLEVIDLREVVESYLLRRAVPSIGPAELAELRAQCDEMQATTDHAEWLRQNKLFHSTLYSSSGAELALELADQLSARVERYLHLRTDRGVQRMEEANREHRDILAAVAGKDADGAQRQLEEHIRHTRARVIELFGSHSAQ
jgi:DNA-binding GntR family transcriptional regulator